MTVYFKCLCKSKDRLKAMELRKDGYIVKITNNNPQWRREASKYGIKLPFIVEKGKARPLWT